MPRILGYGGRCGGQEAAVEDLVTEQHPQSGSSRLMCVVCEVVEELKVDYDKDKDTHYNF